MKLQPGGAGILSNDHTLMGHSQAIVYNNHSRIQRSINMPQAIS